MTLREDVIFCSIWRTTDSLRRVSHLSIIQILHGSHTTLDSRNLRFLTYARYMDWSEIVLYIEIHKVTHICSLKSLFLQETFKNKAVV